MIAFPESGIKLEDIFSVKLVVKFDILYLPNCDVGILFLDVGPELFHLEDRVSPVFDDLLLLKVIKLGLESE